MRQEVKLLSLSVGGYSETDVKNQLNMTGGGRKIAFRYELYNSADIFLGELYEAEGSIEHNADAEIKGTARFNVKTNIVNDIDFTNSRLKPIFRQTKRQSLKR